jgi:hypothetical protein
MLLPTMPSPVGYISGSIIDSNKLPLRDVFLFTYYMYKTSANCNTWSLNSIPSEKSISLFKRSLIIKTDAKGCFKRKLPIGKWRICGYDKDIVVKKNALTHIGSINFDTLITNLKTKGLIYNGRKINGVTTLYQFHGGDGAIK